MIKVVVDRSHAMVSLTAAGFISEADVAAAAVELHAGIRSLGDRAGQHVTLYDLTGVNVATGAVLEAFSVFFTDTRYRSIWAKRVAFVTRSSLVARQMNRMRAERPDMQVFEDRGRAVAWLLAAADRAA
ncbi:hypothetical protein JW805_00685 [Roseomonas aeriglobus]|nr:hypothetical protein [Roseomonas aeriglobus]